MHHPNMFQEIQLEKRMKTSALLDQPNRHFALDVHVHFIYLLIINIIYLFYLLSIYEIEKLTVDIP